MILTGKLPFRQACSTPTDVQQNSSSPDLYPGLHGIRHPNPYSFLPSPSLLLRPVPYGMNGPSWNLVFKPLTAAPMDAFLTLGQMEYIYILWDAFLNITNGPPIIITT